MKNVPLKKTAKIIETLKKGFVLLSVCCFVFPSSRVIRCLCVCMFFFFMFDHIQRKKLRWIMALVLRSVRSVCVCVCG